MKFSKTAKKLKLLPSRRVDLGKWSTCVDPLYDSVEDYQVQLNEFKDELSVFQEKLYASAEHAILIIFQGMDTSGKDGAISHVMSGVNPQGCFVHSFKIPSEDELKHDFLWRTHFKMPSRGEIGIFNRSYYEEVLVDRVHKHVLEREKLPKSVLHTKHFWKRRLEDIRNHEAYLIRQGIKIIKVFLHISKEEQRQRLLSRIKEPKKHWKISLGDFREREYWNSYARAYEACFESTSTADCPWYIIPADDKKNARILISQILLNELKDVPVRYPQVTAMQSRQIRKLKKSL
jgi:PPK2 family polyphosphate:nucleotide phosphotransferase